MSDPPKATPVIEAEATITTDTSCMICGYNLRGMTPSKVCPECGTPIGRSIHGNLLRYADSEWLDKLSLGVRLTLWSILISILIITGVTVIVVTAASRVSPIVIGIPRIVMAGLGLWAKVLVTTVEPSVAFTESLVTLRRAVRGCAIVSFAGATIESFGAHLLGPTQVAVSSAVLGLAGVVAQFGMFIYLRRFAMRIPNPKLAKSTTKVMWGLGIAVGIMSICTIVQALIRAFSGAPWATQLPFIVFRIAASVATIPLLVFGIWYVIILFNYRDAFRKAATQARQFATQPAAVVDLRSVVPPPPGPVGP
ncbi:MAG: hypothetical protein JXQ75_14775 [Phycisphaerae bacterium]|nr:hypothetical protein [Phycisphaerae bacterium]